MNSKAHQRRLRNLTERMEVDSCLILFSPRPSVRNQDVHYPYRTSSDLLYLTGIPQENMIFVLFASGEKHIFIEEHDSKKERWEGRRLTGKDISEMLCFSKKDVCHPYQDFWKKIPELIEGKRLLYWNFSNEAGLNQKFFGLLNRLRKKAYGDHFFLDHLVHSGSIIDEMRLFKDKTEINLMEKAAGISVNAHKKLMKYTREAFKEKKDIFEYELRAYLEAEFMKNGADALAYPSIVASGKNATVLHYITCRDQVRKDDLLLVDAGCEYQGYASDITRTYPVSGKFSEHQKDIYQLVLKAQKKAISMCRPGSRLDKIHEKAVRVLVEGLWDLGLFKKCIQAEEQGKFRLTKAHSVDEVIEKEYYFPFYMHNTSHYLGLDVHDVGAYFQKKKHRPLEPNMTFTVEPGLYFPGCYEHIPGPYRDMGVRIEDNVLITETGAKVLTQEAPKEVSEIENLI